MPYRQSGHLSCPGCRSTALSSKPIGYGLENAVCGSCEGVWFDLQVLEDLLLELKVEETPPFGTARGACSGRPCPRCAADLELYDLEEGDTRVSIEACAEHGLWFDEGEVDPVLETLMAREDRRRGLMSRTHRPWWASALGFVFDALGNWRGPRRW